MSFSICNTRLASIGSFYSIDPLSMSAEGTILKICSYLNSHDIEVFVCLNRQLSLRGLCAASYHQPMLVKGFLRSSIQRFALYQDFIEHIPNLTDLMGRIKPIVEPNLRELKQSILASVKKDLVPALKTVPKEMVTQLLSDNQSHALLQEVALLADFERRIDAADRMPTTLDRVSALKNVCKDLIATKQYERAAKVAMQIPYLCDRGSVLKDVSLALIGDGKSQDAMHVLGEIIRSARLLGEIDFLDIIKALKDKGELQIAEEILHKAIEVAMQTLDPVERASAARSICLALAANERCDRAIELVSQISSDDNEQEIAIYIISKALTKASKFEEAIRFASILTNNRINEFMLIARALIAKKQPQRAVSLLDKAFELTDKISNIEKHESLLRSIAIDFVSVGESEQACIVVSRISDNTKKMQAFTGMAEALIEQGELAHAEQIVEQAAQAAYQICHPDEQQAAFRSIAICFARSCSFEKAADLADRISSSVDRAQVVCFITNALLSAGRLEEAIAVAQSTNNEQMGGLALYDVVKALVKKGDFERASAIAQIIVNDRGQRGLAIELITQALEQKGLGL